MKKTMPVVLLLVLLFSTACHADYSERIQELTIENQQIEQRIAQLQNEISQLTERGLHNVGRALELQKLEHEEMLEEQKKTEEEIVEEILGGKAEEKIVEEVIEEKVAEEKIEEKAEEKE